MSELKEVTSATFAQDVLEKSKEKPVVMEIWASWCGPCRQLGPIIEEIAGEHPEIEFVAVDADANPEILSNFGVRSIPTVIRFVDGEKNGGFIGSRSKHEVLKALQA